MDKPLAETMRPKTLKEFVGQHHLVKEGEIIREIIRSSRPTSLILWGPPGSGKTTLARIIASELKSDFVELSAVTASKKDILSVIERARSNKDTYEKWERGLGVDAMQGSGDARTDSYNTYDDGAQQPLTLQNATRSGGVSAKTRRKQGAPPKFTILFVDEIHRFSKSQQDTFLPHVETGLIILIGATTENPSFEVITPLLSRSRVLVLNPLDKKSMTRIIKRAAKHLKLSEKRLPQKSIDLLVELSGGDARVALGNLELALQLSDKTLTREIIETAAQRRLPGYDKGGEYHYNLISAFIKSMRGSDATATLYYLARMIEAGEDPKFIARRMVIFASEDIGLAGNGGLNLAVSTFQAVERIGLPEAQYNLFHCAAALAKAEKSRVLADAMTRALQAAREYPDAPVPLHLRNAPTKLMKDLGYQQGTKWEAGFKHPKGFLPDEIKDLKII